MKKLALILLLVLISCGKEESNDIEQEQFSVNGCWESTNGDYAICFYEVTNSVNFAFYNKSYDTDPKCYCIYQLYYENVSGKYFLDLPNGGSSPISIQELSSGNIKIQCSYFKINNEFSKSNISSIESVITNAGNKKCPDFDPNTGQDICPNEPS